jgi:ribosome biogenesis GTPase
MGKQESEDLIEGTILNIASVSCRVDTEVGELECAARRRLTENDGERKKPFTVGDRVLVERTGEDEGVVTRVLPRDTHLSRRHPSDPHTEHVIVANVDQLLIVASVREPPLSVGIIDRYVISALYGALDPLICINKIDLADDGSEYMDIVRIYRDLDYPVLLTSAVEGTGVDRVREHLKDKSTVVAGHSGVGKSSLINAIQPGLELRTAPLGWKGKHCTSSVTLLKLKVGGYVADTPGVREFHPWDVEKHEVQQFYPEIWELSHDCRMPDCTHVHEPDCAVREALEAGDIPTVRYDSYVSILESIEYLVEPRETDVDEPERQVAKKRRRPSRRTRKQSMRQEVEEGLEKYYRERED